MKFCTSALYASSLIGASFAATYDVLVGNPTLRFSPEQLMAAVGDTVNFHFYAGNHSVAQSTFSSPCMPSGANALFSGYINPSSGQTVASQMYSIKINSTDTIWIYCSLARHCENGMDMVINPSNSSGQTLAAYKLAAANVSATSAPPAVYGGVVVANTMVNGTNASTTTASSMSASMSMSASGSAAASVSSMMSSAASSASAAASSAAATSKAGAMVLDAGNQWNYVMMPVFAWLLG